MNIKRFDMVLIFPNTRIIAVNTHSHNSLAGITGTMFDKSRRKLSFKGITFIKTKEKSPQSIIQLESMPQMSCKACMHTV